MDQQRWRGTGGYMLIMDPGVPGGKIERDTQMCVHCQHVWTVNPGSGIRRGYCLACTGVTCGRPKCEQQCSGQLHFMKQIEEREAADALMARVREAFSG